MLRWSLATIAYPACAIHQHQQKPGSNLCRFCGTSSATHQLREVEDMATSWSQNTLGNMLFHWWYSSYIPRWSWLFCTLAGSNRCAIRPHRDLDGSARPWRSHWPRVGHLHWLAYLIWLEMGFKIIRVMINFLHHHQIKHLKYGMSGDSVPAVARKREPIALFFCTPPGSPFQGEPLYGCPTVCTDCRRGSKMRNNVRIIFVNFRLTF
jgi:hypothetical protein